MYVCHVVESSFFFVWTIFLLLCMWRNQGHQDRFFSHFSRRWITNLLTHGQIEIQTLSGKTAQMCMLAWSFSARICVKYLNHMNWYDQFGLNLHLHPFFLVQSAKALARLCECAYSLGLSLLKYAIRNKITWTGMNNLAWALIYIPSF